MLKIRPKVDCHFRSSGGRERIAFESTFNFERPSSTRHLRQHLPRLHASSVFFLTSYTVHAPKVSLFFQQKTLEKWDTLGTFTQNVPFLDYNKTKKEKSGTLSGETLSGHGLYIFFHKLLNFLARDNYIYFVLSLNFRFLVSDVKKTLNPIF